MKFEEIEWHDQILKGIKIDRENPGDNDSIELTFVIDGSNTTIIFNDVYQAELNLNFGVIAEETLRYGLLRNDGIDVIAVYDKWNKVGAKLETLTCFEFNTNSTNSVIRIYALSYVIIPR